MFAGKQKRRRRCCCNAFMHFFSLIFLITFFFFAELHEAALYTSNSKKKKSGAYLNAQIEACLDTLCSFFFSSFSSAVNAASQSELFHPIFHAHAPGASRTRQVRNSCARKKARTLSNSVHLTVLLLFFSIFSSLLHSALLFLNSIQFTAWAHIYLSFLFV